MTPGRVAYVLKNFPKISETFVCSELAELQRRGVELRIFALNNPGDPWSHEIVDKARLVERTVYHPETFVAMATAFQPQIVHAHFATEPTAAAMDLAARLGVPFTFTAHGYDIYRDAPADFSARAAAAQAVVTVSHANAEYITQTFGVPISHLRVIPCGVDTHNFRPGMERAEPPVVACVARLVPVKNHGLLLEACANLMARGRQFRCLLAGDGKNRDAVASLRARLALEHVVEMLGPIEQAAVRQLWQRASIGVLASKSEGMPVSLMEAAACGVPVVATAVGGVPELVIDGETGILVPADVDKLTAALGWLLTDRALADRMGRAARRRAEEHFSVTRQVDRLLELWYAILKPGVATCTP